MFGYKRDKKHCYGCKYLHNHDLIMFYDVRMMAAPDTPDIVITPPSLGGGDTSGPTKLSLPVRAHSFESAQCIWSRAAKHAKVLGRVSSLDSQAGALEEGIRGANMTSMYKVVKTVTSTKHRHEPFTDFYEVYEEIGR